MENRKPKDVVADQALGTVTAKELAIGDFSPQERLSSSFRLL